MTMIDVLISLSAMLAVESLVILVAMGIDLAVGIRKAKERGEARTSYGLSRTATKMLTYFGAFFVAGCIDALLHIGKVWTILGIGDLLNAVPVVATLIAVFLCFVELMSIRESADEKTRKRFNAAADTMVKIASKSDLIDTLAKAIIIAQEQDKRQEEKNKEQ